MSNDNGRPVKPHRSGGGRGRTLDEVIAAVPLPNYTREYPATKEQWVARCAARYELRGGLTHEQAIEAAEASLENLNDDLTENPEDAADEDMTCWQD